ncbi:uncharacterized protein LOC132087703 [Daphnia carinata]|uniref:uncharacterized protein LOC132087703 n=1 Tax=Daphnia carinata TaxID=120202 RepID=UPI00257F2DAD|nr:uncharacterized protein LOC132087703 [Daphnia carinata]
MDNWLDLMRVLHVCVLLLSFSTSAFTTEDKQQQLTEGYLQLKETMESLLAKVAQLETKNAELETNIQHDYKLRQALASRVYELEANVSQLETTTKKLQSLVSSSQREHPLPTISPAVDSTGSGVEDVALMPTSCRDLRRLGHVLNGLYSVVGVTMIETVFCDFAKLPDDAGFQKWIGYTDVKSMPTYFYVQRDYGFSTVGIPIPFHLERLNTGNAMNLTSGIFTAPRQGIYFFSFSGVAYFPASYSYVYLGVGLYMNGDLIGLGWFEQAYVDMHQYSPLSLQSTLNLQPGDEVWLQIYGLSSGVLLSDGTGHYTDFTGWMLEEDISQSLSTY